MNASARPATGRHGRVLVVEDDDAFARALARSLGAAGIDTRRVASVAAARRVLRHKSAAFKAVLLDVQLPDGSGLSLLDGPGAAIRAPVVVLSGHVDADDMIELRDRCAAVLPKPVSPGRLVQLLTRLMASHTAELDACAVFARHCKLSPRERRVLIGAVRGQSTEETAAELGVAVATLHTHWRRIKKKTGLRSRPEVVAAVLRFALSGQLPPRPRGDDLD